MSQRRVFSPQLKAEIALASIKGDKSLAEIASEYEFHPNQVSQWKRQFLENASKAFDDGKDGTEERDRQKEIDRLYRKIGQLEMDRDFLKKKKVCRDPHDEGTPPDDRSSAAIAGSTSVQTAWSLAFERVLSHAGIAATVDVHNSLGNRVHSFKAQTITQNSPLDLHIDDVPNGVYYLRISTSAISSNLSLIIQK
jgi:transposase